jgi:hypothetical protein
LRLNQSRARAIKKLDIIVRRLIVIKFEVKEGDYIDCDGVYEDIRRASIQKLKLLGFEDIGKGLDPLFPFVGVTSNGTIGGFEEDCDLIKREITLEQLMFCDQPDDVTHCYYDGENITYNSGDPYAGALICTREPAESKDWYEKGELPSMGEVCLVQGKGDDSAYYECSIVGYDKVGVSDVAVFKIKNYDGKESYYSSSTHEYFRPIQSERDKLIDRLKDDVYLHAINGIESISMRQSTGHEIAQSVMEYLYDECGWRPTND